jgi:Flp pilus assembly pilin Flp
MLTNQSALRPELPIGDERGEARPRDRALVLSGRTHGYGAGFFQSSSCSLSKVGKPLTAIMGRYRRLISFSAGRRRRAMVRLVRRALRDDRGGEVLEYSLIAGLIVVGAIGAIQCVGEKVLARWSSLNSSI